jgi:hypothetical protein
MQKFKYQYGRLSCRLKATGVERGREDWQLTRNRDGTRTLRCLSLVDDSCVVRDVCYTLGADWRPAEVFVRLQVGSQPASSGHFRLSGTTLEARLEVPAFGEITQHLRVPLDTFALTPHSGMLYGWIYFNYDRAKGGEQSRTHYNMALDRDALDGPLGRLETYRVALLGDEEVTVPVGTFRAAHLRVDWDEFEMPPTDLWVAGEDRVLLRCDWNGLGHEYVLTKWKTETKR